MQRSSYLAFLGRLISALVLSFFVLGAAALAAEEAAATSDPPAAAPAAADPIPATRAPACPALPSAPAAAPTQQAGLGDPLAPAQCVADCTQNPDIACWGSTCVAIDQSCQNGQRGFVQCDGGPVLYCNVCPECPEACPQGISCTNDDDCCATTYGEGFCINGTCQCDF